MPNPRVKKVATAVASGNDREALVALRDRLAADIDHPETTPRDRAAIVKQLQAVLQDINGLPDPTAPKTPLDLIKEGREKNDNDSADKAEG